MTRRRGGKREQRKKERAIANGIIYKQKGDNKPLYKILIQPATLLRRKMVEENQRKLQAEIDLYKQVQKDYHKALVKRQQLDGQLNENTAVKKELDILKSGNQVYKLIGPVLVKQDLVEAKQNVSKRMEYISNELKRTEDLISDLDKKQETHRETLDKLQQLFQQAQLKASKKA